MQLYDQRQWAEPPLEIFDDPILLHPGQWIDWSCEYENMEQRSVSQGSAATDEMCAFIGMYYPRDAMMESCAHPESGRAQLGGINLSDGELDGQGFLDCLLSGPRVFTGNGDDPRRYESQACFTNTCAAVSPLTQPFLHCLGVNGGLSGCGDLQEELAAATCDAEE